MRVSSPVGEFPYEIDAVELRRSELVLRGHMGAWPSHVALAPGDALALARAVRGPLLVAAGALTAAGVLLAARRR